jgi:hypothetical protein
MGEIRVMLLSGLPSPDSWHWHIGNLFRHTRYRAAQVFLALKPDENLRRRIIKGTEGYRAGYRGTKF